MAPGHALFSINQNLLVSSHLQKCTSNFTEIENLSLLTYDSVRAKIMKPKSGKKVPPIRSKNFLQQNKRQTQIKLGNIYGENNFINEHKDILRINK